MRIIQKYFIYQCTAPIGQLLPVLHSDWLRKLTPTHLSNPGLESWFRIETANETQENISTFKRSQCHPIKRLEILFTRTGIFVYNHLNTLKAVDNDKWIILIVLINKSKILIINIPRITYFLNWLPGETKTALWLLSKNCLRVTQVQDWFALSEWQSFETTRANEKKKE